MPLIARWVLFAAAAVGLAAMTSVSSASPQAPWASVGGPLWVTVAKPVTLYARSFPPRSLLTVELERGRDVVGAHSCCSSRITRRFRADEGGNATIRFRWPVYWQQSPPPGRGRWRDQDVAFVFVTSAGWGNLKNPDAGRATKLVFVSGS